MTDRAAPADLVARGRLRGAYGVRGWVRLEPYAAEATVLLATRRWWLMQVTPQPLQVAGCRRQGASLVAKWQGCETPEAAEALKGLEIAVARAHFPALPDGEHYWVDLIGATVVNREGEALGIVQGLRNNGAHDLLEVEGEGASILIPMVPAYVDEVDAAGRTIRVDWQRDW
ncbi:MAG: ribosome maturation factor RimM [Betaproteobacteria bacterium]